MQRVIVLKERKGPKLEGGSKLKVTPSKPLTAAQKAVLKALQSGGKIFRTHGNFTWRVSVGPSGFPFPDSFPVHQNTLSALHARHMITLTNDTGEITPLGEDQPL